jgi:hypothetical protein
VDTWNPHIFAWMDRFCEGYSGGIWSFYTLSNGGAFMAPELTTMRHGVCSTA